MQQLIAWFQGLSTQGQIGLGLMVAGVVWALWSQRANIGAAISTVRGKLSGGSSSGDSSDSVDVLDLKALERVSARADRRQCPEMKAAVIACQQHFFHGSDVIPPAPAAVSTVSTPVPA